MGLRSQWEAAYLATTYEVESPEGCWKLRVGKYSPKWEAWLYQHNVINWTMLTAVNPGSQALSQEKNESRQQKLHSQLQKLGVWWLSGRSYGDDGEGEVEPMVWIANLALESAVQLSQQWQQAAFVRGEKGKYSRLCFLDEVADFSQEWRNNKRADILALKKK